MPRYIDADKIPYRLDKDYEEWDMYIADKSDIDKIPTADVTETTHGKWLMCLTDEDWERGYHGRCSVCGNHYTYNINKMPRRCDYCDALMDL